METLIASVVLPAIIDLFKGSAGAISRKFFGLSVDDQIKVQEAEVSKLKALADLDNPHGTPSQWVVDLRASFRYVCAVLVILVGCGAIYAGGQAQSQELLTMGFELIGMPFGFIFGERLYLGLKGSMAK